MTDQEGQLGLIRVNVIIKIVIIIVLKPNFEVDYKVRPKSWIEKVNTGLPESMYE